MLSILESLRLQGWVFTVWGKRMEPAVIMEDDSIMMLWMKNGKFSLRKHMKQLDIRYFYVK